MIGYCKVLTDYAITRIKQHYSKMLVAVLSAVLTSTAYANPVVDNVAHGNVSIQQTQTTTTVNQASQKAIINWHSFNIGNGEHTHFNQPNGGVALNRINPNQGASQIYGRLSATGKIILINPAGIYIGPNAFINVGGLIASTAGISDQNFLNDYYKFDQVSPYNGMIVNQGTIIAAEHGLVALMGNAVSNEGNIEANLGKVVLGSGQAFTMSFAGNDLISFTVDQETMQRGVDINGQTFADGVKNTGTITANGGQVIVHAKAASDVLDHVINMDGLIQANSVHEVDGEIYLSADNNTSGVVRVAGEMKTTGYNAGEKGGNITVAGYNILVDENARLNATGDIGAGNIRIGGNYKGAGPIPNATNLILAPGAQIHADALTSGNGGEVILWSNNYTQVYGNISAKGGANSGNGGFVETSGKGSLYVDDLVNVDVGAPTGNAGSWLLDPKFINVQTSGGSAYANGTNNLWANNVGGTTTITPASINSANANIILQANTDVTFIDALSMTNSGRTLTVQAGRSIIIQNNISTTNAAISMTANDSSTTQSADRTTGSGDITIPSAGLTISSGTGAITFTIGTSTTNPFTPGAISASNGTIFNRSGLLTFDNVDNGGSSVVNINITGTGGFTKQGTGSMVFGNSGSYSGATNITNGTLQLNGLSDFGSTSSVTVNGGTLKIFSDYSASRAVTLTGTGYNNQGALLTQVTTINNFVFTLSGGGSIGVPTSQSSRINTNITGSGGFTKLGTGMLQIAGTNTYSGSTTVSDGNLQAINSASIPSATDLILGNTSAAAFTNSATITVNSFSGGGASGGQIGGTIIYNGNGSNTFFGTVSANITKNGTGTLTLSSIPVPNGSGGGTFTVNNGILQVTDVKALGDPNVVNQSPVVVNSGATYEVAYTGSGNQPVSIIGTGFGGVGALNFTASNNANFGPSVTLTGNASIGSVGSTVGQAFSTAGAFNLTKVGTGTLVLRGPSNSHTGTTTVSNGTLQLDHANALVNATTTSVSSGGTLAFNFNGTFANTNTISIAGAGASSVGALNFMNTVTLSNPITLTANASLGSTAAGTMNGAITDGVSTFNLTKEGIGTIILVPANSYSGTTTINNGTLQINNLGGLSNGGAGGTTTVASGGQLLINVAGTLTNTANISIAGSGFAGGSAALSIPTTVTTLNNNIILTADSTINGNFNGVTLNGVISDGAGTFGVRYLNGLILNGNNTYKGNTYLQGNILKLTNANALGSTNAGTITIDSNTALEFNFTGTFGNTNTMLFVYNAGSFGRNVNFTAAGSTTINNAIVSTQNTSGVLFNNNSNSTVTIGGTINMTAPATTANDTFIFISANANAAFNIAATVGNTFAPYTISLPTTSTTTITSPLIRTISSISFQGNTLLGSDTTLQSTSISFSGTLNSTGSPRNLNVYMDGYDGIGGTSLIFNGTLGNSLALGALNLYVVDPGRNSGNININNSVTLNTSSPSIIAASSISNLSGNITNNGTGSITFINDLGGNGFGSINLNPVTATAGGVNIYYNPNTFGTPVSPYSGGTTPTMYMYVKTLGTATDSATTSSLGALSNPSNTALWASGKNYALAHDIDADVNGTGTPTWNGGAGFSPIGNTTTPFAGIFDGMGHNIYGLFISRSGTNNVGLFGAVNGTVQNVGVINANITGSDTVAAVVARVNASGAVVKGSFSTGTLTGTNNVGGVVGLNVGTVNTSWSSATVNGSGNNLGGLVGQNQLVVSTSYTFGSVIGGGSSTNVGGFVGLNTLSGDINDSYSISSVTGATGIGGFVGRNDTSGSTIVRAYSTGSVTGTTSVGGFAGINATSATISNSFWDTATSAQGSAIGSNSGGATSITGSVFGASAGQILSRH